MLDREHRFFYNLCARGHIWEIYGDLRTDRGVIHGKPLLVFTYASLFDMRCPDPRCDQMGSVRLHNPNGYEVYCYTVCKHCGKATYAAMARDTALEGRLDHSMQQFRYRLKVVPLFCHDCTAKMKSEEYSEVVS